MRDDHAELRGGRAASALCAHRRPEGLEWRAHGAKRSAQPRNTGPIKAARCEDAGRPLRIEGSTKRAPSGTELRRRQWRKQAKRKSNEQRRLASGSVARRLLRIEGTGEYPKRAQRAAEARRAEVASTRSEAQCAATEHRAAKSGTVRRCRSTIANCGCKCLQKGEGPKG